MTSEAGRSTVVVVLGAGRSGTSALTRGLAALGVDLGAKLRPGSGKNPTGFFEDEDILALNKRLKRRLGIRGHSVRLIDDDAWAADDVRALQREAVEVLRRRFSGVPLWGYKYGRTLRMLPFWQAVFADLDLDVRYVVALRNPLSVARSRSKLHPERGRQAWNDMEWLVNVVPYFDRIRGHATVVVDFDQLLGDPAAQLERVAKDLRLPLGASTRQGIDEYAHGFLKPGMRHSRFQLADVENDPQVNWLVKQAYGWLDRAARDEASLEDAQLWQDWARIQAELNQLAPMLQEFDHMRQRLNRALWNPATPLHAVRQVWRDLRSR